MVVYEIVTRRFTFSDKIFEEGFKKLGFELVEMRTGDYEERMTYKINGPEGLDAKNEIEKLSGVFSVKEV
jgi:hypothetical protein